MGDERKVVSITSARSMPADEVERRTEWAEAAERDADSARAREASRSPEDRELEEALEVAEAYLYTTKAGCLEYLPSTPPEVAEAMKGLEQAIESAETWRVLSAIQRLTAVLEGFFPPDGSGGPKAAQASLGIAKK